MKSPFTAGSENIHPRHDVPSINLFIRLVSSHLTQGIFQHYILLEQWLTGISPFV